MYIGKNKFQIDKIIKLRKTTILNYKNTINLNMKKLIIKHQNSLILSTLSALNSTSLGVGIKLSYDIKLIRGKESSQLEFSRKDKKTVNTIDFFMLGYLVGRDYDK
jgi:hypothetical protein